MGNELRSRIASNLESVRERIAAAAERAGRIASDVRLIAVTKYVGVAEIRELLALGCSDLGESRPQALWEKAERLRCADSGSSIGSPIWHLIGHLQRNKARRTLPLTRLIHSVDGQPLIRELDACAAEAGRRVDVLLEVNVSADRSKHGFNLMELRDVSKWLPMTGNVGIRGFMAMSGLSSDSKRAAAEFASLRELRDRWRSAGVVDASELSMGMSNDFEVAIAEGATMVRIGSALFEGIRSDST